MSLSTDSPGPSSPRVTVVVPVLDEVETVDEFYRRAAALGLADRVVFVDNGSTDGTLDRIAAMPGVRLVRHERNLGYGASIRDGIATAAEGSVVIIDADLEYPVEAIPDLVAALERDAVVYGSRFLGGRPADMPWLRRFGNRMVSALFNLFFRQRTTDFYTGIKALRRDALDRLALRRDGFEHVVELGAQLSRAGFRIAELPVVYVARRRGASKMRHVPEILKYLGFVVYYRLGFDRGAVPAKPSTAGR